MEKGLAFVPLDCRRCGLWRGRSQVVPAEGAKRPLAFFVGEAPGPDEDIQGRPFVGRAGKILRAALAAAGWREDEVWITNVVKCFPFDEEDGKKRIRAPMPEEKAACASHLAAEVEALRPRLLVALGRTAAMSLGAAVDARMESIRGTVLAARAPLRGRVFVTYHPSGLHYGKGRKELFEEDLVAARRLVLEASAAA